MRDDIHKKVPLAGRVQQWVKLAVNDADRENGRSLPALDEAIDDTCRREISEALRRGILRALQASELFGPLGDVHSPRDLGSRGGHLERELLSETKRLLECGHSRDSAAIDALAGVLRARVQAYIRAVAPALHATQEPKAHIVLDQMHRDAAAADYHAHARAILGDETRADKLVRPRVDADENMLGVAFGRGRRP